MVAVGVLSFLFTGYVEKPPSSKWKYPNCRQNRGVGVLFSACVLSPVGSVRFSLDGRTNF